MEESICPECGAKVAGGREGCQALLDELTAQAYTDLRFTGTHDLAFDAYCMQHVETYCRSAKSYAAHLTRLCCGLEHGGRPEVYAAIQKWLNGSPALDKPAILPFLGRLTILHVRAAASPEDHRQRVRQWAEDVWAAYASQQELARGWIQQALNSQKEKR